MIRLFLLLLVITLASCSSYVRQAYWGKKTGTSIRGYPTLDPPPGYTGVWTHYKHDGSRLAEIPYVDGQTHGTSFWYRDDGSAYLIRQHERGHYVKDYRIEPPPEMPAKIPFWYPARR